LYNLQVSVTDVDATVKLHGIDLPVANAIRNALFNDVPVYAVDTMTFVKYDGVLEPEYITTLAGLVPIKPVAVTSAVPWRDDLGAAPPVPDTGKLYLDSTADPDGALVHWVTSQDLTDPTCTFAPVHYRSERLAAAAVHDRGIRICPLLPGQRIQVSLNIRRGTRRVDGTRWSAVMPVLTHDPSDTRSFTLRIEALSGAVAPLAALDAVLGVLHGRMRAVADGTVPLVHRVVS
jgi:hypothetical protein